jgi:hypothetical protein
VRHRRRRRSQSLRPAQADREIGDLQRVEEGEGLPLAALQVERKGRPRAGAVALVVVSLARTLFEETKVSDRLHFRMIAKELAHFLGAFAGA